MLIDVDVLGAAAIAVGIVARSVHVGNGGNHRRLLYTVGNQLSATRSELTSASVTTTSSIAMEFAGNPQGAP